MSTKKKLVSTQSDSINDRKDIFNLLKAHHKNLEKSKSFYNSLSSDQKCAIKYITFRFNLTFIQHYLTNRTLSEVYTTIPFPNYKRHMTSLGYTISNDQSVTIDNIKNYVEEFINAQISQCAIIDTIFNMKNTPKLEEVSLLVNNPSLSESEFIDFKIGDIHTINTYSIASIYNNKDDIGSKNKNNRLKKKQPSIYLIITNAKNIPCINMDASQNQEMTYYRVGRNDAILLPRGINIKITNIEKHQINLLNKTYHELAKLFHESEYDDEKYDKITNQKTYTIYTCEYVNRNMDLPPIAPYVLTKSEKFSINNDNDYSDEY